MERFVEKLRQDVERRLAAMERCATSPLALAHGALCLWEEAFAKLKEHTVNFTFTNIAGEIDFFKRIKPRLFCNLIYWRKLYNLEMNLPVGSDEKALRYLRREQERLSDFFDRNLDFYRYYRSGASYDDGKYFTRGDHGDTGLVAEISAHERDPRFSTAADFKVAKILTNDRLSVYLQEQITRLERPTGAVLAELPKERHSWTDKKIKLIELVYALVAVGCTDNGKRSVKEAIRYVELMLNVDLGNFTRSFYDICIRDNPTQFLDELKESLLRTIEELNGRQKPKKK